MANPHGDFIWYELLTQNPDRAKQFYDDAIGWQVGEPSADLMEASADPMDYRQIAAGDEFVGGVFRLSGEMVEHGARPVWLGYVGVDDVDATLRKVEELGGAVLMPAKDIPDVGRLAMVADPQGVPFYVMRGAMEDQSSTAFSHKAMGHCAWNELTTPDQDGALAFYGQLFGWENRESMPMGEAGDYKFIHQNGDMIGAVSPQVEEGPGPGWTFYFHVPDIGAAVETVKARGGKVLHGPHEVPGGDYIIIGSDPEGVTFALVGAKAR